MPSFALPRAPFLYDHIGKNKNLETTPPLVDDL